MVITETLNKNVLGWVTLGIVIVVGSIVLLQFKAIDGVGTCGSGFVYNTSTLLCNNATNTIENTSATGLPLTIDKFVAGIAEPENWVAIVIIAIIGFAILGIFLKRKG